jgi:hypothetical protein
MSINDLTLKNLNLGKQKIEKEDEIRHILIVLNDENIYRTLLFGRDYWVRVYNRKVKEYKEFCNTNNLKTSIFMKVIK